MNQFADCSLRPNQALASHVARPASSAAVTGLQKHVGIRGISVARAENGSVAINRKNGLLSRGKRMDDTEHQAELWRIEASNRLLQSAHAIAVLTQYDDSVNKEWAESRIGFFHQTADELHPTEEAWPELPPNVIPFTTIMRRK